MSLIRHKPLDRLSSRRNAGPCADFTELRIPGSPDGRCISTDTIFGRALMGALPFDPRKPPSCTIQELLRCFERNGFSCGAPNPIPNRVVRFFLALGHDTHKEERRLNGKPALTEHIWPVTRACFLFAPYYFYSCLRRDCPIDALTVAVCIGAAHDVGEKTRNDAYLEAIESKFGRLGHFICQQLKAFEKPPLASFQGATDSERREAQAAYYCGVIAGLSGFFRGLKCIDVYYNTVCDLFRAVDDTSLRRLSQNDTFYVPMAFHTAPLLYHALRSVTDQLRERICGPETSNLTRDDAEPLWRVPARRSLRVHQLIAA